MSEKFEPLNHLDTPTTRSWLSAVIHTALVPETTEERTRRYHPSEMLAWYQENIKLIYRVMGLGLNAPIQYEAIPQLAEAIILLVWQIEVAKLYAEGQVNFSAVHDVPTIVQPRSE